MTRSFQPLRQPPQQSGRGEGERGGLALRSCCPSRAAIASEYVRKIARTPSEIRPGRRAANEERQPTPKSNQTSKQRQGGMSEQQERGPGFSWQSSAMRSPRPRLQQPTATPPHALSPPEIGGAKRPLAGQRGRAVDRQARNRPGDLLPGEGRRRRRGLLLRRGRGCRSVGRRRCPRAGAVGRGRRQPAHLNADRPQPGRRGAAGGQPGRPRQRLGPRLRPHLLGAEVDLPHLGARRAGGRPSGDGRPPPLRRGRPRIHAAPGVLDEARRRRARVRPRQRLPRRCLRSPLLSQRRPPASHPRPDRQRDQGSGRALDPPLPPGDLRAREDCQRDL